MRIIGINLVVTAGGDPVPGVYGLDLPADPLLDVGTSPLKSWLIGQFTGEFTVLTNMDDSIPSALADAIENGTPLLVDVSFVKGSGVWLPLGMTPLLCLVSDKISFSGGEAPVYRDFLFGLCDPTWT